LLGWASRSSYAFGNRRVPDHLLSLQSAGSALGPQFHTVVGGKGPVVWEFWNGGFGGASALDQAESSCRSRTSRMVERRGQRGWFQPTTVAHRPSWLLSGYGGNGAISTPNLCGKSCLGTTRLGVGSWLGWWLYGCLPTKQPFSEKKWFVLLLVSGGGSGTAYAIISTTRKCSTSWKKTGKRRRHFRFRRAWQPTGLAREFRPGPVVNGRNRTSWAAVPRTKGD